MRWGILSSVLVCAACATAPVSYLAPAPNDGDPYACALRSFNELGFAVANADREAGFITGERQTSGLGTAILTGKTYFDHITISIFDDSDGGRTMRVTAGSANQSAIGFGNASRTLQAPQASAKEAANAILEACSTGEIVEQGAEPRGAGLAEHTVTLMAVAE